MKKKLAKKLKKLSKAIESNWPNFCNYFCVPHDVARYKSCEFRQLKIRGNNVKVKFDYYILAYWGGGSIRITNESILVWYTTQVRDKNL